MTVAVSITVEKLPTDVVVVEMKDARRVIVVVTYVRMVRVLVEGIVDTLTCVVVLMEAPLVTVVLLVKKRVTT